MTFWKAAFPVWLHGKEAEMNIQAKFSARFLKPANETDVWIHLAAADLYKLWVNGAYVCSGPARTAHGYARVDRIKLTDFLRKEENLVQIQVSGGNKATLYVAEQTPFCQAEILADGEVLAATGENFCGAWLRQREQKVMRYAPQRGFMESWDMTRQEEPLPVVILPLQLTYLERVAPMPEHILWRADSPARWGTFQVREDAPIRPVYYNDYEDLAQGIFPDSQLERRPYYEWQKLQPTWQESNLPVCGQKLRAGQCVCLDLGQIRTGFLCTEFTALEVGRVFLSFDEMPFGFENRINFQQNNMINLVEYRFYKGQWNLESFEPYTLRYLYLYVVEGEILVKDLYVRDFGYPMSQILPYTCKDPELAPIYEAARQTLHQSVLDIYMDTPGRERAGWLCDSYFIANAEYQLTGDNPVERAFVENFRLYQPKWGIPEGMLPKTYPSEHPDGGFIPQWPMWLMLEMEEFFQRTPDADKNDYRDMCLEFMTCLEQHENEDGLLEKLPSWNFVDNSVANDWVMDVNYPTNMLYSRILQDVGTLYDRPELICKGQKLGQQLVEMAFRGDFFRDHSIRNEAGVLENQEDTSEACQYYAALFLPLDYTQTRFAAFRERVVTCLGRDADMEQLGIAPGDMLVSRCLRMELLLCWGEYDRIRQELKERYLPMVAQTGTFWEHKNPPGSFCHGFGAFLGGIIQRMEATAECSCT